MFRQFTCHLSILLMVSSLFSPIYAGSETGGRIEKVRCDLAMDRGVLPAGRNQMATLKITLEAPVRASNQKRPPVNLALVIDRSGSMSGKKLSDAKLAAIETVKRLGRQDIFSLIVYGNQATTLVPAAPIKNPARLEKLIQNIQVSGSTALFAGVSQGASEIRKHQDQGYFNRLVLLSDGMANIGPQSPVELSRLGTALAKESISVSTVGLGNDYNEDLMTGLSQASDGNTYFAESSNDLSQIFDQELGDVLNVAARDAIVTIEYPLGIRPLSIIGREGRVDGQRVTVKLNQLYGGQEKFVLVETVIEDAKAGESREIAQVELAYVDALNNQTMTVQNRISSSFSDQKKEVLASIDRDVQRASYLTTNTYIQDKAVELADQGQVGDAVQELEKASVNLRQAGERNQDPVLLKKAEEMKGYAQQIKDKGLSKKQRKKLRTDSYQQRSNQVTKPKQKKPSSSSNSNNNY